MGGTKDEAYERRREQVRRAQKTHRERKATYVKTLENEVAGLREQNAALQNELATSRGMTRRLEEALAENGISLPADNTAKETPGVLATIQVTGKKFPNQQIEVQLPSPEARSLGWGSVSSPSETMPTPASDDSMPQCAHPQGLDAAQVGVNFVLALEQPCLYHHKITSPELLITGSVGNGHVAMLSSPIMARAPSFSFNPLHMGYNAGSQWTTPAAELESLLQTSQNLELDGEVTPVQVWQIVKQHPKFQDLNLQQLEILREKLFPLVKCLGFGAVIQQAGFEQAMAEVFFTVS